MKDATPADFASEFESEGFSAHNRSSEVGGATTTWGSCWFGMNGKKVVVRSFAPAGQPHFTIVSVDGQYDTLLGKSITDWMILKSGVREERPALKRPARVPDATAHLYATSLFGFDADPARIVDALHATAAAEGWSASDEERINTRGDITIGRYAFADAEGKVVTVEMYSPRFRQTLVEVSYPSSDPDGPLKVFNGLKDRLGLRVRTPESSPESIASANR